LRAEAEARNARHRETREARSALEKADAELAATQAELVQLTERLGDPATYADAALVRQLIESHNQALDRVETLTAERERLAAELATADTAS
jgi:DNA repair exonuclease SbcCD ATPase subunit